MSKSWSILNRATKLLPGCVHVWRCDLELPSETLALLEPLLSADESERGRRFVFDKHRFKFIAARSQLRQILAHYLSVQPAELKFDYGPQGKPVLTAPWSRVNLNFNMSHSGGVALCAVAYDRPVGVDIEEIRLPSDYEGIARQFFAPSEISQLESLSNNEKCLAFFRLWTRKEAVLKAVGAGLTIPLNQIVVTMLASEPARVVQFADSRGNDQEWWIEHLEPNAGYLGAVASKGSVLRLELGTWNPGQ